MGDTLSCCACADHIHSATDDDSVLTADRPLKPCLKNCDGEDFDFGERSTEIDSDSEVEAEWGMPLSNRSDSSTSNLHARSRDSALADVEISRSAALERKIAIFDFDSTLSTYMTYDDLGGSTAQEMNMLLHNAKEMFAMNPNFWLLEFGGRERVQKLDHMLTLLQGAGVALYICSFNDDSVIVEALGNLGLLRFFTRSDGSFNILSNKLGDKGKRVSLAILEETSQPQLTMFIDDSIGNCQHVLAMNPGVQILNCGEMGLNNDDMQKILHWFDVIV